VAKANPTTNQNKQTMEKAKYDFSKYISCDCKMLAAAYGLSISTFKRNVKKIKPQLDNIRQKIRPGSPLGPRYWTNEMLQILFDHMGGEPSKSIKEVQSSSVKPN